MAKDRPDRAVLSRLDAGALIHECREHAGLSQAELAERLGTTQSAISRWEHGHDSPRVDTLGRIFQACGFEADLTFRRHDDEDRSQIRFMLSMTPEERVEYFRSAVNAYDFARQAGREQHVA